MQTMLHPKHPSIDFNRLPKFGAQLNRVLRHVRDPEVSPEHLQSQLAVDQDLTESVMRVVNHPLFGARAPVQSLSQAIACLGRDEFHDLLFTVAALSLFRGRLSSFDAAALRSHSLACGILSRDLARKLRCTDPGTAYRAGLVHDIGLIAVGSGPREASSRAAARAAESGEPLVDMEETMLGLDHAEVGLWYGERLGLERPLLEAIRFHHQPEAAPAPRALAATVGLSDHICRSAGCGYGYVEDLASRSALAHYPAWRILCDEVPALKGQDAWEAARETLEQLPVLQEASVELCEELTPA